MLVLVVEDEGAFMGDFGAIDSNQSCGLQIFLYSCPLHPDSCWVLRRSRSGLVESEEFEHNNRGKDALYECRVWVCREGGGGGRSRDECLKPRFRGFPNEGSCELQKPCKEDQGKVQYTQEQRP